MKAMTVTDQDRLSELVGTDNTIYTLTAFTKSQTDYVRVFVVKDGEIVEITYLISQRIGRKIKPHAGIAYRGGGYSKGLEAAMDAAHTAGHGHLDQSRWREL